VARCLRKVTDCSTVSYADLLHLARVVRKNMRDLHPRDMIDLSPSCGYRARMNTRTEGDGATHGPAKRVRHKSKDIDDLALLDVVKALRRRVRKISHAYDVPYIAGYSRDGKTVSSTGIYREASAGC